MNNKNSECFLNLMDILKKQKFNFTLEELYHILNPKVHKKLFGRICLASEKFESDDELVKSWNLKI